MEDKIMANVVMKAPEGMGVPAEMNLRDGNIAKIDINGYVSVDSAYLNDLLSAGFQLTHSGIAFDDLEELIDGTWVPINKD